MGSPGSRRSTTILRWLLGIVFVFAAPNHYLQVVKDPPMPDAAVEFHHALTATGYVFQLVVVAEFAAGLLLLMGRAVPFALVLLTPIIVNIFAFHLFLAPGGLPIAAVLAFLEGILAWQYRAAFADLF
jgi:uncharacterized membrane protein YphA (DoxX/SURF4 family)